MAICSQPGCPAIVTRGTCPQHTTPDRRPSAAARGYGPKWRRIRAQFLKHHPRCALCPAPATVADHHPLTRRQLLEVGDPHPDAWHHLRPLCEPCHARHTATHDGSFGRPVTPIEQRLAGADKPRGRGTNP